MAFQVALIGVGNEERGDDGVGLLVLRTLRASLEGRLRLLELGGRVDRLLEALDGCEVAIIVDAVQSGAPAGVIHRFEYVNGSLPTNGLRGSTHTMSVGDALELAWILKKLPSHILVYGIEGRAFDLGDPMTPEVRSAAQEVCQRILEDVGRLEDRTIGPCPSARQAL
ncbi:MAG: hydrogenase maturation protease [Ignavibacteria bacterium]|nr:hydrogenase maturation protease [Ignavibacteria bacterium]